MRIVSWRLIRRQKKFGTKTAIVFQAILDCGGKAALGSKTAHRILGKLLDKKHLWEMCTISNPDGSVAVNSRQRSNATRQTKLGTQAVTSINIGKDDNKQPLTRPIHLLAPADLIHPASIAAA